jgi:hypothetical protein
MNSAYGKTIQKAHNHEIKLFDDKIKFDKYLSKNYNRVLEWTEYGKGKIKAKVAESITNHFNRAHIGVEILSMSKRIMNEVICLAEDNNLNIYYQDTDSIHIEDKDITVLEKLFKIKYNKNLIGKNMGQFHSDFKLLDKKEEGAKGCKNIIAIDSIFLGKKSYIDKLQGEDENGNIVTGYHSRMKGIPEKSIYYYCEQNKTNIFDVYKRLYNVEKITFDLTCGGTAFKIKHHKDYSINVVNSFKREVKF